MLVPLDSSGIWFSYARYIHNWQQNALLKFWIVSSISNSGVYSENDWSFLCKLTFQINSLYLKGHGIVLLQKHRCAHKDFIIWCFHATVSLSDISPINSVGKLWAVLPSSSSELKIFHMTGKCYYISCSYLK
jgi:hypothetical protein